MPGKERSKIAALIRVGRKELQMTQAQFAEAMGISTASVSRLEAGQIGIALEEWERFCSLVGVPKHCGLHDHIVRNVTLPRASAKMRIAKSVGEFLSGKDWRLPWRHPSDLLEDYDRELAYLATWRILSSVIRPTDAIRRIVFLFHTLSVLADIKLEFPTHDQLIIVFQPTHQNSCSGLLQILEDIGGWGKPDFDTQTLHPECFFQGATACRYEVRCRQVKPSAAPSKKLTQGLLLLSGAKIAKAAAVLCLAQLI